VPLRKGPAHATLPESLEETNQLRNMPPMGDGYTVPWAMSVDTERRCYLNSEYTFYPQPGGTVQLYVHRDKAGAYHVRVPRGERYTTRTNSGGTWFAIRVASVTEGV
jgi:hypothetical protein